jgi:hypothetical protein
MLSHLREIYSVFAVTMKSAGKPDVDTKMMGFLVVFRILSGALRRNLDCQSYRCNAVAMLKGNGYWHYSALTFGTVGSYWAGLHGTPP